MWRLLIGLDLAVIGKLAIQEELPDIVASTIMPVLNA